MNGKLIMRRANRPLRILFLLALAPSALRAEVLRVPADHPTIKSAVSRAADGDEVVVDDGVYLEKNIVIAKAVTVRSRTPYGATIYGSASYGDSIFIVRAACRIEGFMLRNGHAAVEQRGSPDVRWEASDLAIFDCLAAVAINDAEANVGSAAVRRVAVFGRPTSTGFSTNDAGHLEVSDCLVVGCDMAFQGYDHLSFKVRDALVLDCGQPFNESASHRPVPPATSRIDRGEGVRALDASALRDARRLREIEDFLETSLYPAGPDAGSSGTAGPVRAVAALVRGLILEAGGAKAGAARGFAAARSIAERTGVKELVWRAMMGAARVAEGTAAPTDGGALALYEEAAAFLESWLSDQAVGIYRVDFLDEKLPVFEAIIRLLLERHGTASREGWSEKAFRYAERSHLLASRFRAAGIVPEKGSEVRAKTGAARAIVRLQTALQDPDLSAGEKERLIGLLESAEEDYHGELIRAERVAPAAPSPIGIHELRGRLAGDVMLAYVLGNAASYAFLVTGDRVDAAVLPGAGRIGPAVERYLRFLQLADGREFAGETAGRRLFEMLVGPFAAQLTTDGGRLIVVPDGVLHYLPFEALVRGRGSEADGKGRGTDYLGRTAEIRYAASATEAFAATRTAGAAGRTTEVLAVGSADAIACDNRSRLLKRSFDRLEYVDEEIRSVQRRFADRRVTSVLDVAASERWLKSAGLRRFGVIHIAAHGVIDDVNWWRSALLLAPDPDGAEDGFLTALEIPGLPLDARLVVLSGCGTGNGRLFLGAGIKGLSGAFLRAGAEQVVVSLWNVDDRATARLMSGFYERLAAGDPPSRALAEAKISLMGSGYANPFYWAPFVLIGRADGRALFDDEAR